jgi:hypothetical protein
MDYEDDLEEWGRNEAFEDAQAERETIVETIVCCAECNNTGRDSYDRWCDCEVGELLKGKALADAIEETGFDPRHRVR